MFLIIPVAAALLIGQPLVSAEASPLARLYVRFAPKQLGRSTNISFAIRIATTNHEIPPPLTGLDIRFPRELGFAVSGLGLATCTAHTIEIDGPAGCPHNSWMGRGKARAEVPFGPETLSETASVSILRAPDTAHGIAMLFAVEAWTPVITNVILPGELQAGQGPYETIHVNVPLVETLPGAPDVSVVQLSANIGPHSLVYYEKGRGHLTPYHPEGILLPRHCPAHGFRFQAVLNFVDQTTTTTGASIRCRQLDRYI